MLLSLLYLRHEAASLLLADEDEEQLWWGSNILMAPQIFEWFVIGGGKKNNLGQPCKTVAFSLHPSALKNKEIHRITVLSSSYNAHFPGIASVASAKF